MLVTHADCASRVKLPTAILNPYSGQSTRALEEPIDPMGAALGRRSAIGPVRCESGRGSPRSCPRCCTLLVERGGQARADRATDAGRKYDLTVGVDRLKRLGKPTFQSKPVHRVRRIMVL